MKRVLVLGRGGAGKSTFAARLGTITRLPVVELDKHFWSPDLTPVSKDRWREIQIQLTSKQTWILDGDLGPYDALETRLPSADTIVVLDFSLWRCAWRAARRSRENLAFWRWLATYRRRSLPAIKAAIEITLRPPTFKYSKAPTRSSTSSLEPARTATMIDETPPGHPNWNRGATIRW